MARELAVIRARDLSGYFLVVEDLVASVLLSLAVLGLLLWGAR